MKFFLFLLASAAATFESCGYGSLSIKYLEADPPDRVAAGQPVTMRFHFTVPQGVWIPSGTLRISTKINMIPVSSWEENLCSYIPCPLLAGEQEVVINQIFPTGVWGRVRADIKAMNGTDTLLCARWSVWATGRATNESSWLG
jgi:hypothetical protein